VLSVIYLGFNEGYSASYGASLTRADLSHEAIRLGRLVFELLPDPEVCGLLALMLLHESRRVARVDPHGDLILLEEQDRACWDQALIAEGQQLVRRALASRRIGFYTLQAAISAVHAEAKSAADTDWRQIAALYDILLRVDPSPIVQLNRAVAIAMRDGPAAGLELVDAILQRGELTGYHLAQPARGEFLRRMGDAAGAANAFRQALSLAKQDSERRFLEKRLDLLGE
ncbi:MAG: RNA polymerase subunit sigma-24, partial [Planctomycetales bacterium]|nr:RNA polymerase subunit sigma-24 [Planctomycetales bacterium]